MAGFTAESIADLKRRACGRIDEMEPALIAVSRKIWETPELGFQEQQAVAVRSRRCSKSPGMPSKRASAASTPRSPPGARACPRARRSACSASTTPCRISATAAATTCSRFPGSACRGLGLGGRDWGAAGDGAGARHAGGGGRIGQDAAPPGGRVRRARLRADLPPELGRERARADADGPGHRVHVYREARPRCVQP